MTVEVATPLAVTGPVPEINEFAAMGEPAANTTVPPVLTTGVAIDRVLVSAVVEASVHVEVPVASEEEQAP